MFVFAVYAWAISPAFGLFSVSLCVFFACFLCLSISSFSSPFKRKAGGGEVGVHDAGLRLDQA